VPETEACLDLTKSL